LAGFIQPKQIDCNGHYSVTYQDDGGDVTITHKGLMKGSERYMVTSGVPDESSGGHITWYSRSDMKDGDECFALGVKEDVPNRDGECETESFPCDEVAFPYFGLFKYDSVEDVDCPNGAVQYSCKKYIGHRDPPPKRDGLLEVFIILGGDDNIMVQDESGGIYQYLEPIEDLEIFKIDFCDHDYPAPTENPCSKPDPEPVPENMCSIEGDASVTMEYDGQALQVPFIGKMIRVKDTARYDVFAPNQMDTPMATIVVRPDADRYGELGHTYLNVVKGLFPFDGCIDRENIPLSQYNYVEGRIYEKKVEDLTAKISFTEDGLLDQETFEIVFYEPPTPVQVREEGSHVVKVTMNYDHLNYNYRHTTEDKAFSLDVEDYPEVAEPALLAISEEQCPNLPTLSSSFSSAGSNPSSTASAASSAASAASSAASAASSAASAASSTPETSPASFTVPSALLLVAAILAFFF